MSVDTTDYVSRWASYVKALHGDMVANGRTELEAVRELADVCRTWHTTSKVVRKGQEWPALAGSDLFIAALMRAGFCETDAHTIAGEVSA